MATKKLKNLFEQNDFKVHLMEQDNVQCAEIETWTNGGVNMIHFLNPFTIEEFEGRVNDFDVDEEIDLHREGNDYKNAFTIRESVEDFEDYHNRLKDVLSKLQAL
jgi:hypothetical protein